MGDAQHDIAKTQESRKIFALSQLTESIRVQIDRVFDGTYWITAEISKLNYYPQSGHCYPQLVEKKAGKIVADIRAFISSLHFREINRKFLDTTCTALGDGMQIMFRCGVSYHAVYGLSLRVVDVEPAFTLGEMARQRHEALQRLKSEGLFGKNRSLTLSLLIRRIAVISVETSKGYRDFASIIASSPFAKAIEVKLFPALLQGDAAVPSIRAAFDRIRPFAAQYDAVALIRGGGGEVGLDCYDHYPLGEVVCNFPIPVITGIGHATNLTVVEQVACKNLITPTDLGRFVLGGFESMDARVNAARRSLSAFRRGFLQNRRDQLNRLEETLGADAGRLQQSAMLRLESVMRRMGRSSEAALRNAEIDVAFRYPEKLRIVAERYLLNREAPLAEAEATLSRETPATIKNRQLALSHLAEKAKLLDPVHTLRRGYSITTVRGVVVRQASELKPGDELTTRFGEGTSTSTVKNTNP